MAVAKAEKKRTHRVMSLEEPEQSPHAKTARPPVNPARRCINEPTREKAGP